MQRLIFLSIAICAVGALIVWQRTADAPHGAHVAGDALVEVSVPDLSATATKGRETFNANCAMCHGVNASGVDGAGPPLVHIVYEPNHHGDMSFYMAVRQGVRAHHWPFGNMPAVEGVDDTEVATIISYIRELQRANGIF